jgi:hypothetical protein
LLVAFSCLAIKGTDTGTPEHGWRLVGHPREIPHDVNHPSAASNHR